MLSIRNIEMNAKHLIVSESKDAEKLIQHNLTNQPNKHSSTMMGYAKEAHEWVS